MPSFKDLMEAQAARAAREKQELELAQQQQKERERQVQEEKMRRAKEDEDRQKRLRALARQKEKEEAELAVKKMGDDDGSAKNGSVDKKHLVAEAKSLGLLKSKQPFSRPTSSSLHIGTAGPSRSIGGTRTPRVPKPAIQLSQAERRALRAAKEFEDVSTPSAVKRKTMAKVLNSMAGIPAEISRSSPSGSTGMGKKPSIGSTNSGSSPGSHREPERGLNRDSRNILEVQRAVARSKGDVNFVMDRDGGSTKDVKRGSEDTSKLARHREGHTRYDDKGKHRARDDGEHRERNERYGSTSERKVDNRSSLSKKHRPKTPSTAESEFEDSDDLDRPAHRSAESDRQRPSKKVRREKRGYGGGGSILAQHGLDIHELFGRKGGRERYADDSSSSDMEATPAAIAREEARAARLAREADRLEEEKEKRRAEEKRRRRLALEREGGRG